MKPGCSIGRALGSRSRGPGFETRTGALGGGVRSHLTYPIRISLNGINSVEKQ